MAARTAEELFRLFVDGFARSDPSALAALYHPEAVISGPDQAVRGRTAILEMLRGFLAKQPVFRLEESRVVEAAGLALLTSRWTVTLPSPTGEDATMSVRPTLAAQRQANGDWLVVIDRPAVD
jgi:uncharacterized protein (TIGR02246 family)